MIKTNYSIGVTQDSGCFNVPHKFILSCQFKHHVIKAIQLRGFQKYPFNGCEINVHDFNVQIIIGLKRIEKLDEVLAKATDILGQLVDISDFELNVAKALLN